MSDFQKALISNNENLAGDFIDELREGGRLSSENLLFLKFERYAQRQLNHEPYFNQKQ